MFSQQWLSHLNLLIYKSSINEAQYDIDSMTIDELWALYINLRNKRGN